MWMMVRIRKSTTAVWLLMGFLSIGVFAEPSKFNVFIGLENKEDPAVAGTVDGCQAVVDVGQRCRHTATAQVDIAVKLH
jgi:hypothetical protein